MDEPQMPQTDAPEPMSAQETPAPASKPAPRSRARKAAPAATTAAATLQPEEIARRAYEIYSQRGGEDGRHEEDWHQAERELRESAGASAPRKTTRSKARSA